MNGHSASMLMLVLFLVNIAQAQTNFREGWEKANPIPKDSKLDFDEKVKAHQGFLDTAVGRKDSLQQLYGNLYLFYDYLRSSDFPEASRFLLQAEGIAEASGNLGWQGWVRHRKAILSLRMKDHWAALKPYQEAVVLCRKGGDSLCVAESLEQVGSMYALLDSFELAKPYFDQAIPLMEKYGGATGLAITLNNVGIQYSRQERPKEAIPYFERAIAVFQKQAMHREEAQGLNNLADSFRRLKQFDNAIKTYQQCVAINNDFHFPDNLLNNYSGMHELYSDMGDYRKADEYLIIHYNIRDSILGAQAKEKIAVLEAKYDSQQKELALQKSQAELALANVSLERRNWFIFTGLLLICFGIWRWILQARRSKQKQELNQQNLANLTRILLEKNTLLINLEESLAAQNPLNASTATQPDFETDLYNQHILTDSDWSSFKAYFERAHPGYIQRLHTAYPSITNAEKRLFLLIKINLTTKEAAAMLGISAESVKRTRTRLRKRLGLSEEIDLDSFIKDF